MKFRINSSNVVDLLLVLILLTTLTSTVSNEKVNTWKNNILIGQNEYNKLLLQSSIEENFLFELMRQWDVDQTRPDERGLVKTDTLGAVYRQKDVYGNSLDLISVKEKEVGELLTEEPKFLGVKCSLVGSVANLTTTIIILLAIFLNLKRFKLRARGTSK